MTLYHKVPSQKGTQKYIYSFEYETTERLSIKS